MYYAFTLIIFSNLRDTWTIRYTEVDNEELPFDTQSEEPEQQHAEQQRSLAQHKILYGIESCNKPAYNLMVETQLQTWGARLPRENFVIVGGARDDFNDKVADEELPCEDKATGLTCKEAVMFHRAAHRARTTDADWLSVGQDDKFIWPEEMAKAVIKLDPRKPAVYAASFGCGMGWKHTEPGKRGVEKPKKWRDGYYACKGTFERGSICGGSPYLVSRGALDLYYNQSATSSEFVAQVLSHSNIDERGHPPNSDLASSCFFYGQGIPILRDENSHQFIALVAGRDEGKLGNASKVPESNLIIKENGKLKPPLAAHMEFPKDEIPSVMKRLPVSFDY